jgi:hypothetical protein
MTVYVALMLSLFSFVVFCVMLMMATHDRDSRRLTFAALVSGGLIVLNLLLVATSARG